jgi:hypothetical protein
MFFYFPFKSGKNLNSDNYDLSQNPRKWASDAAGDALMTKIRVFMEPDVLISNKNQRFSVKRDQKTCF